MFKFIDKWCWCSGANRVGYLSVFSMTIYIYISPREIFIYFQEIYLQDRYISKKDIYVIQILSLCIQFCLFVFSWLWVILWENWVKISHHVMDVGILFMVVFIFVLYSLLVVFLWQNFLICKPLANKFKALILYHNNHNCNFHGSLRKPALKLQLPIRLFTQTSSEGHR